MHGERPGDWTCHQHGVIDPDRSGIVPACPECGAAAMQVRRHRGGWLVSVQPWPEHCGGPDRHPFGPGRAVVVFPWLRLCAGSACRRSGA